MAGRIRPNTFLAAWLTAALCTIACGHERTTVVEQPIKEPAPPADIRTLPAAGEAVERAIDAEEIHRYDVDLDAGMFLRIVVEQHGTDVEVTMAAPASEALLVADGPTEEFGRERVALIARETGPHHMIVRALASQETGTYALRVEACRPATDEDRQQARAYTAFAAGERLYDQGAEDEAAVAYHEALGSWRALGDQWGQASAQHRLGLVEASRRHFAAAADHSATAANLFQGLGDDALGAMAWHNLGRAHFLAGDLAAAAAGYQRAVALRRRAGDDRGVAITLTNLGVAYRRLGKLQVAIETYQEALDRINGLDDAAAKATVLNNLGGLHRILGEYDRAHDRLREALRLRQAIGDRRREASTLDQLGRLAAATGNHAAALAYFHESLTLVPDATNTDDRYGAAVIESRIGRLQQRLDQYDDARRAFERSLATMRALNDRRSEAHILLFLGTLENQVGHPEQALDVLARALNLHRHTGEPAGEAEVLVAIAAAQRRMGMLDQAWSSVRDALAIFESLRGRALATARRTSYLATATVQDAYTLEMAIAMDQHRRSPSGGWDRQGLAASERARARSLLDLLAATGTELRRGADPALLSREQALGHALSKSASQLQILANEDNRSGTTRVQHIAAQRRFRDNLEALTAVTDEIRASRSQSGDFAEPQPLSPTELQRDLLDEHTLLLEYWLGDQASYLWVLGNDTLHSFELPPRHIVEPVAQRAHALLQRSARRETAVAGREALCALTRLVLAPAAAVLDSRRLLIAADGALRTLPLAALPDPAQLDHCHDAAPLVESHEVLHLPSASVLAVLRRHRAGRATPSGLVAVVADPVFSLGDSRVRLEPFPSAPEAIDQPGAPFRRLPFTTREADAILAHAHPDRRWAAIGFDARRDTILDGTLAGFRIVHFATHAIINTTEPQLSGIALSSLDQQGEPIDGFLRMHEIYGLELNADLVTLSACRSALGKAMAGEGLVGLTHGFFHAGAERLLVSLWPVDDRATAELMARFYQALLVDGLAAGAALRRAQRELLREPAWSAPYYWAGFVLQGEWR